MNDENRINKDAQEIADVYNKHGQQYHESRITKGRFFNEFLEMPATLSLIPEDLSGKNILDAGCGSGLYAREMAKRGAKVLAVDISQTMIDIAQKETPKSDDIIYQVGNICELKAQSQSLDLIICNYVLENISDISSAFREFKRILKPGASCIYSISHPLRGTAEKESFEGHEIWKLKNYFDRGVRISDFGQGMRVKKYKRTLSDYLNAAIDQGFAIQHMIEPQPIPAGEKSDPIAYEMAMRLPQLLLLKMHSKS